MLYSSLQKVFDLVPPDVRSKGILLAVSGGSDSIALLYLLFNWIKENDLDVPLEVASIDHGIRPESKDEILFVKSISQDLGLHFHTTSLSLGQLCSEDKARQARLSFLEKTLENRGLGLIATGHTLEDHVETMLMRIIRGTGLRGLSGIRPYSYPYVRPLYYLKKEVLRNYLKSKGLSWKEDPSNQSLYYFRNRIRHQLLPLLLKENPNFMQGMLRLSENSYEEHVALEMLVKEMLLSKARPFLNGMILSWHTLKAMPKGAAMLGITLLWQRFKKDKELTRQHALAVLSLDKNKSIMLPEKVEARLWDKYFYIGAPINIFDFQSTITTQNQRIKTPFGNLRLVYNPKGEIHISRFPVTLCLAKGSQKIKRKGVGSVEIKNLYSHIPLELRKFLLAIHDKDEVLWVEGIGPRYPFIGKRYSLTFDSDQREFLFEEFGIDRRIETQKVHTV